MRLARPGGVRVAGGPSVRRATAGWHSPPSKQTPPATTCLDVAAHDIGPKVGKHVPSGLHRVSGSHSVGRHDAARRKAAGQGFGHLACPDEADPAVKRHGAGWVAGLLGWGGAAPPECGPGSRAAPATAPLAALSTRPGPNAGVRHAGCLGGGLQWWRLGARPPRPSGCSAFIGRRCISTLAPPPAAGQRLRRLVRPAAALESLPAALGADLAVR